MQKIYTHTRTKKHTYIHTHTYTRTMHKHSTYVHTFTLAYIHTHIHISYLPVIGVHEMHGRMHPNYWQITILLVVDLCSSLAYFMMTQPLPIAGKLPIKTLVAKQLPTHHAQTLNIRTYTLPYIRTQHHAYTDTHKHTHTVAHKYMHTYIHVYTYIHTYIRHT